MGDMPPVINWWVFFAPLNPRSVGGSEKRESSKGKSTPKAAPGGVDLRAAASLVEPRHREGIF